MAIGWVDLDAKDIEVGTVETIVVFLDTHLLGVCGYGLTCGLCPCMLFGRAPTSHGYSQHQDVPIPL